MINNVGDALKKAQDAKASRAGVVLPDLDKVVVIEVSDATLAAIEAEGQARKEWAENAGVKLARIEVMIEKLKANSALSFSEKGKDMLKKFEAAKTQILSVSDETIQGRVAFAMLLEQIRMVDRGSTQAVVSMLRRLIAEKRFHEPDQTAVRSLPKESGRSKFPAGTIFFPGMILFSCRAENGEANGAQKAVETEARRMVDEYKKILADRMKDSTHTSHDLSALEAGKVGRYYVYVPARESAGRRWPDGNLIVEVVDRNAGQEGRKPFEVVMVCDGTGSCASLAIGGLKIIPLFWLQKGEVITGIRTDGSKKLLPKEDFDRAVRILRTLQAGVAAWKESKKPAESVPVVPVEQPKAEPTPKPKASKKTATRAEAAA